MVLYSNYYLWLFFVEEDTTIDLLWCANSGSCRNCSIYNQFKGMHTRIEKGGSSFSKKLLENNDENTDIYNTVYHSSQSFTEISKK